MLDPNNSQHPYDWSSSSAEEPLNPVFGRRRDNFSQAVQHPVDYSTSELEAYSPPGNTELERTQVQVNRFVTSSHVASQHGEIPGSNSSSEEELTPGHDELRRKSRLVYINMEPQQTPEELLTQSYNLSSDSEYPLSIYSSSDSFSSQSQLLQSGKGKAPAIKKHAELSYKNETRKETIADIKFYDSLNRDATRSKKHDEQKQRKMSSQTFSPQGLEESSPLLQPKAGCSSDYHPINNDHSFSPDEAREVDSSNRTFCCCEPLVSVGYIDEDEDAGLSEMTNSNGDFTIQYKKDHISTFTRRRKSTLKSHNLKIGFELDSRYQSHIIVDFLVCK